MNPGVASTLLFMYPVLTAILMTTTFFHEKFRLITAAFCLGLMGNWHLFADGWPRRDEREHYGHCLHHPLIADLCDLSGDDQGSPKPYAACRQSSPCSGNCFSAPFSLS